MAAPMINEKVIVYCLSRDGEFELKADGSLKTMLIDRTSVEVDTADYSMAVQDMPLFPGHQLLIPVDADAIKKQRPNLVHPQVESAPSDKILNIHNKFMWNDAGIRLLVSTRQSFDDEFQRPRCKKAKLWGSIAKKMKEVGGYDVSGNECDEKWRNLQATYKRNKDKMKSSGHEAVAWEYFEIMDEAIGSKASSQPAPSQLFHSLPSLVTSSQICPSTTDPSIEASQHPQASGSNSCKTSFQRSVPNKRKSAGAGWVETYREQQEKRNKIWDEQKILEQQKIDAINNLAAAITRLADRPEQ